MMEWKECKLSELCVKVTDGSHFSPKAQSVGYPMFSVKDMLEYGFDYKSCKRINKEDFDKMVSSGCVPQKDDILVAKDGSYLKQIFRCKETKDEAILSSIAIFRPNKEIINPSFLCYLLKSPKVYNYISKNCVSGSALPRIVLKSFKEAKMQVPPLGTQFHIASILSSLDAKIEINNKINVQLEEMAQAIFKNWFVDFEPFKDGKFVESELGLIPEGWRVGALTEIAKYLNGLAMQKFPPENGEESLPVLKIKELGQGAIDANSDKCSSNIKKEYIIEDGDVVFSWSGTLMVDIWCGGKCGLNQHLFKVSSDTYPKWFYLYWTKFHLDKFIRIAKDKAVTMGHIKRGELDSSMVLIPSDADMVKVSAIMNPLVESIISNRIENNNLAQLRDTLLPKLMNGEIEI